MKTALFTGSFDPITKGHLDLIKRSSEIFQNVIVAVGDNPAKKYLFTKEQRVSFIYGNIGELKNVQVVPLPTGKLAADLAYEHDAVIIKGVRVNADFDYEKMMQEINYIHNHGVDTMIFPCRSDMNHISSTATKEVCKLNGNTEDFVTLDVKEALESALTSQKRIVVTGTIGSGKSTIVSEICKQLGEGNAHNIDLDVIAHDILFHRNEPIYVNIRNKLKDRFMLNEWSRKSLGDSVFANDFYRKILNSEIRQPMLTRIRGELQGKTGVIIFNGALIIESDWLSLGNNKVVLLTVNPEIQKNRLKERGYSDDKIEKRLKAQLNTSQKKDKMYQAFDNAHFGKYFIADTSYNNPVDIAKEIIKEFF